MRRFANRNTGSDAVGWSSVACCTSTGGLPLTLLLVLLGGVNAGVDLLTGGGQSGIAGNSGGVWGRSIRLQGYIHCRGNRALFEVDCLDLFHVPSSLELKPVAIGGEEQRGRRPVCLGTSLALRHNQIRALGVGSRKYGTSPLGRLVDPAEKFSSHGPEEPLIRAGRMQAGEKISDAHDVLWVRSSGQNVDRLVAGELDHGAGEIGLRQSGIHFTVENSDQKVGHGGNGIRGPGNALRGKIVGPYFQELLFFESGCGGFEYTSAEVTRPVAMLGVAQFMTEDPDEECPEDGGLPGTACVRVLAGVKELFRITGRQAKRDLLQVIHVEQDCVGIVDLSEDAIEACRQALFLAVVRSGEQGLCGQNALLRWTVDSPT